MENQFVRKITIRCHTCQIVQDVFVTKNVKMTRLDDELKKIQCKYADHLIYSVKALEKEIK